jgi:hypothetical protein
VGEYVARIVALTRAGPLTKYAGDPGRCAMDDLHWDAISGFIRVE